MNALILLFSNSTDSVVTFGLPGKSNEIVRNVVSSNSIRFMRIRLLGYILLNPAPPPRIWIFQTHSTESITRMITSEGEICLWTTLYIRPDLVPPFWKKWHRNKYDQNTTEKGQLFSCKMYSIRGFVRPSVRRFWKTAFSTEFKGIQVNSTKFK